ncbi:unnamed protein product [Eruca vesicaria subsp. sativa]|uniref:non-specific serine/threonine protein kinase n=1 Tax=Eruca vesicaria subsp. sativa TaxID=29727 RepID=A0ABC8LHL5_ERUVS|nr:unnamed protein product [Eruca vesicaria subsp. sativa]
MINLNPFRSKSISHRIIWILFVIPSCVFSANEFHRLCTLPFSCGNQSGLLYPFWISGREACGHPDFKLDCSGGFAELNMSSVKYRILEVNYEYRFIRLARSDYIGDLCPKDPLNEPFDENVLPFAPNTDLITIYYDCRQDFSLYVSTYVGVFSCGDDGSSYYVTRNLSSPLLDGVRGHLYDFDASCKIVSVPANGPWLDTLQINGTRDNLQKALAEGFKLEANQDCLTCLASEGVCGYNESSGGFVCYCVDEPLSRTCASRKNGQSFTLGAKLGIGTAAGLLGIFLSAGGYFCFIIQRRKTSNDPRQHKLKNVIPHNLEAIIPLKHYSYAQLKRITNSFAEVVGKGGFGTVYRGTLCDGRRVAVKILKDSNSDGEDFINEVGSMSKTSHVNIVELLGFCYEGSNRAIIYEFLENGSLDKFISNKTSVDMDWTTLYQIALGVARGLEYLHHGCKTRIVHFDIKPQNVLLDVNLCPKLSDFGLAKLCEKKESILSMLDTRGTIGYIAPELFSRMYGRVSHKSDVYSYGMLVLEMIGARNKEGGCQDSAPNASSTYFPEWIYKDLEKRDSGRLIENVITSEEEEIAKKITLVGLWCIQSSPSDRPPMNRVVEMMEGSVDALEVPPKPVFQIPAAPFQEPSTLAEDISGCKECGNITAGFPFWGMNRDKICGHPTLELHCNKDITSLTISDQDFRVLQINQSSNSLRLARTDHMGSFCSSNFTNTTLPPNLFKLSPTYKSVTVIYSCNPFGFHYQGYKCPEIGLIFVSDKPENYKFCLGGFTANVPRSFVTENKDLAYLESILKKGFEVKVKIDKSEYEHGKHGPLHPPTGKFLMHHYHILNNLC